MRIIAVLFCGALAACSQTNTSQTTTSDTGSMAMSSTPGRKAASTASADRCQQAVAKAQQQATGSAVLGSALSMAGGLGGFAGRGGAIAAQAVSMGGSVIQAKARNDAQDAVEKECLS
ncbi:MAG: hypothetical protein KF810_00260 [Rhizobiaceae bacterium]|nr:hypothetical protein [Rhizobiaceae bacterium]